jgi:hypothetical protein
VQKSSSAEQKEGQGNPATPPESGEAELEPWAGDLVRTPGSAQGRNHEKTVSFVADLSVRASGLGRGLCRVPSSVNTEYCDRLAREQA